MKLADYLNAKAQEIIDEIRSNLAHAASLIRSAEQLEQTLLDNGVRAISTGMIRDDGSVEVWVAAHPIRAEQVEAALKAAGLVETSRAVVCKTYSIRIAGHLAPIWVDPSEINPHA